MKYLHIFIIFVVLFCCWDVPASAQNVNFRDANLAAAVRTALGLEPGADIPEANLQDLTNLRAHRTGICDLTGIENLTSLSRLVLHSNQISDLSPLESLTGLETLYLHSNQISDLSPLESLTGLRFLTICYNSYTDPSPLAALTSLRTLYIDSSDANREWVEANMPHIAPNRVHFCVAGLGDNTSLACLLEGKDTPRSIPIGSISIGGVDIVDINDPVYVPRPPPTPVAQDRIIFNEIRNAEDDKNDWIELKNISDEPVSLKGWEISIMNIQTGQTLKDEDMVAFPDYTLPPDGVLLIVNTDPSETDLIRGQNIQNPESNPDVLPQYLNAPDMRLPNRPYLLILRSATDKNGKPEAFEDLTGNYFRNFYDYRTQIAPLMDTLQPLHGTEVQFDQEQAWQRVAIDKRGYMREAWALSGYQSGLGYRPGAPMETSLGTPGYPTLAIVNETPTGQISFSEVMFTTNSGLFSPSLWIELYNSSLTELVNLKGWELVIESRDSEIKHRYTTLELNTLEIMPNQTVLLVTRDGRNSGHLSEDRVYSLYDNHDEDALSLGLRENSVLRSQGFALRLLSPSATLVDIAGNLDSRRGNDTPEWELPQGWTESGKRTSLTRRYKNRVPLVGTQDSSWVRTADTAPIEVQVYWGNPTDHGTPGYKQGGILPVTLSLFRANRVESAVVVKWTTASEIENAGFNILRSQRRHGQYVKVNPSLILGAGTTSERHDYEWTDTTTKANIMYYYRIEDVSLSGERRQLATVRLRGHVSAAGKRISTWGDLKFQE